MLASSRSLLPFLERLEAHASLSAEDRDAVLALPHKLSRVDQGEYVFREGDRGTHCTVILSGFACRHTMLPDGSRQIVALHMRGDSPDLQNALMVPMEHNIQALSPVEAALVPAEALGELIAAHPAVARAIWVETLIQAAIQREWTINVGRRDARTRIAHLLCEIGVRQEAAGLGQRDDFELPVTQEQLADVTALTAVHVNRVLQGLGRDTGMKRTRRRFRLSDWNRLAEIGEFEAHYLMVNADGRARLHLQG